MRIDVLEKRLRETLAARGLREAKGAETTQETDTMVTEQV